MLHTWPRPVTIYIWQRMATSTKHPCGVRATAGLAPLPRASLAPGRPPLAGLLAILSPVGRARHPHGGTSGPFMDDFSPFSRTSPPPARPPRPLQGPSSSLCVPSSAERQARVAGSQRAPLSSSSWGSIPTGAWDVPPREWDNRGLAWPWQSPTALAVPSKPLADCRSRARPWHSGGQP